MSPILVIPSVLREEFNYLPELVAGFELAVRTSRWQPLIMTDDEVNASELATGSRLAYLLTAEYQVAGVDRLIEAGHDIVCVNRYTGKHPVRTVRVDDAGAMVKAVAHLSQLGHSHIAFIGGPENNPDACDRLAGFLSAAVSFRVDNYAVINADYTEEAGQYAGRQILSSASRPTALVCASDVIATGAMRAARELGLALPVDLSVTGFGDFPWIEYIYPGITTIQQPRHSLGYAAGQVVIDDDLTRDDIILDAELIVRESTAENRIPIAR